VTEAPDVGHLVAAIRLAAASANDESRRLFHGRGGTYPGLESISVDWHPPVALVTVHGDVAEPWLPALADELRDALAERLTCVLVQRRALDGSPIEVLFGAVPAAPLAREDGLTFRLNLGAGQNIGFFGDMKQGRATVRRLAAGKSVLNLFAYTCAHSVAALAGGAQRVVNIDMSRKALEVGRQNHLDNGLDIRRASFLAHDVFKSFGKLRKLGPFDLVIVDPPTNQGRSFSAERDYPRAVRRLPSLVAHDAHVVACLNSPRLGADFLVDLFAEHMPTARLVEVSGAPDSFPELEPDKGLKVLDFQLT
jgi:23S rRNA (cytosine1962-C5)-methyltransferase